MCVLVGARLRPACLGGGDAPLPVFAQFWGTVEAAERARPRESVLLRAVLCPGAGQRLASIECFLPRVPGQLRTVPGGQGVLQPQALTFTRPEATRPSSMSGKAGTLCRRSRRVGLSCTRVPSGYWWLLLRCWASRLSPRLIRLVLPRVTWGTRGDVNTERGASSLHPPAAAGQRCERPAGRVAGNTRPF